MKRSLEILMDEHRHIERACRILSAMAEMAENKGLVDPNDWQQAIDFIRGFADKCHHGKEEDQLFKVLRQKGFPVDQGPIGVMLSEHEVGRNFVKGMISALEDIKKGNAKAAKTLAENALGYTQLLPQHIWKEDNILYRIANDTLSDEDEKELLERYRRHEHKEMGKGAHEKFLKSLNRLAEHYGEKDIPLAEGMAHGCMGCH